MSKPFALMIESACNDFEALSDILNNRVVIGPKFENDIIDHRLRQVRMQTTRAEARIIAALAKSFVFFTVRARRICEHEASSVPALERDERRRFMGATKPLVAVRDVNEHGSEASSQSKETLHMHQDGGAVSETALCIFGPDQILMGPLNLATIYPHVDRARQLAGFQALRPNA